MLSTTPPTSLEGFRALTGSSITGCVRQRCPQGYGVHWAPHSHRRACSHYYNCNSSISFVPSPLLCLQFPNLPTSPLFPIANWMWTGQANGIKSCQIHLSVKGDSGNACYALPPSGSLVRSLARRSPHYTCAHYLSTWAACMSHVTPGPPCGALSAHLQGVVILQTVEVHRVGPCRRWAVTLTQAARRVHPWTTWDQSVYRGALFSHCPSG